MLALDALGISFTPPHSSESMRDGWTTGHWLADFCALIVAISVSLYLWTLAAGARRGDEISAGAFGVALAMVGWWVALLAAALLAIRPRVGNVQLVRYSELWQWLITTGGGDRATGFHGGLRTTRSREVRRGNIRRRACARWTGDGLRPGDSKVPFSQAERSPRSVTRVLNRSNWLKPPFESALSAVAWKQFRESGLWRSRVWLASWGSPLELAANFWFERA